MYSESAKASKIIIQPPLEVQPVFMSVFMDSDEPYRPTKAHEEVCNLRTELNNYGVETITIKEALLKSPEQNVHALRDLALKSIDCKDNEREKFVKANIFNMSVEELVDIILINPTLTLIQDSELKSISPDAYYEQYKINPLFGLMFPRDHFIITNKGIVLGNFKRKDRRKETNVIRQALKNMGEEIVGIMEDSCYLEGGDFFTTNKVAFINNGIRTNSETIQTLLTKDLIGTEYVVELIDLKKNPEEFHLDHFFNILTNDSVVISMERLNENKIICNLYRKEYDGYNIVFLHSSLQNITNFLGIEVIPVANYAKKQFSLNFLNLGDNRIICSSSVDKKFKNLLSNKGVEVISVSFNETQKQFGSIHCSTQVLVRNMEI
jgi:arginine deiminase